MRFTSFTAILIFLLALAGCSRDSRNPVSSDPSIDELKSALENNQVILSDEHTAIGLFGIYQLEITKDKLTASLIPVRSGSIGESYLVNGGAYFMLNPCVDCLRIDNIGLDNENNIILGFSIKHPFQKGNPQEPPSPTNRLDLDIFDVALLMQPLNTSPQHYVFTNRDAYANLMLNADGYSQELARAIENDTLLPYKICYTRPENNRFEMGTPFSGFNVVLNPSEGSFILYITMAYGNSSRMMTRLEPQYYIPEFNRKAAWRVVVTSPEGDEPPQIGNTWDNWDTTTKYEVKIDIYDWNHGKTVDDNFPDPLHLNYLSAPSDIASVTAEIPGMTSRIIEAQSNDNQTNGWDDPITYVASIANENRLASGIYIGLVKILDSRVPNISNHFGAPDTLVSTPDGVQLQWAIIPEFATYQTFKATVIKIYDDCGPVTGQIISPLTPLTDLYNHQTIDFVVEAHSANNGEPIALYEADWNYDGTSFQADASNTDGIFNSGGPFDNPNCGGSNEPVRYKIAFRATDSCDPPNSTIFAICEATVEYCCGPVIGEITSPEVPVKGLFHGQAIDFQVNAHSPNGGDPIVLYQADWNYDGILFDIDATNVDGCFDDVAFQNPNCGGSNEPVTYTVAFRAMDQCNPPNVMIFATCEVTVDLCPSGQGWVQTWGNKYDDYVLTVLMDEQENIYTSGFFSGTVDFDPGPEEFLLTALTSSQAWFISKFNHNGDFKWAFTYGSAITDWTYVVFDKTGNLFITGRFRETMDFDPGPGVDLHIFDEDNNYFITKFDRNFKYLWTKTWGGEGGCDCYSIIAGKSGDIFIRGGFSGTVDFDPGPNVRNYTPAHPHSGQAFVLCLDNDGNFRWFLTYPYPNYDLTIESFVSDSSGNLLIAGAFKDTVDFNPNLPIYKLTSNGCEDAYIVKLSPNRNFIWAVSWGGDWIDFVADMTISGDGRIATTGVFSKTVDFDPGLGVDERTAHGEHGWGMDLVDAFLSILNSDGHYIYALNWGGDFVDYPSTVVIDAADNILVAGSYGSDVIDFDPGPNVYEVDALNGFLGISKFNTYGEFQWVGAWENTGSGQYGMKTDSQGCIYVGGSFREPVDFDPGPGEDIHSPPVPDPGYPYAPDAFLMKLLPNGLWE